MTVAEALALGERTLPARPGLPDPRREARWLLARALGRSETWLLLHPDQGLPDEAVAAHNRCVEIQRHLVSLARPGAIPSEIYASVMENLDPQFLQNFMGFGDRRANFLGHGVGLQIDEMPVLADGFDEPLAAGMVLALEPKKGIPGVGMVGVEDTFVVGPDGAASITGTNPGLIPVEP